MVFLDASCYEDPDLTFSSQAGSTSAQSNNPMMIFKPFGFDLHPLVPLKTYYLHFKDLLYCFFVVYYDFKSFHEKILDSLVFF